MGYYSGTKKKEILSHATTWTNLEDIMLSEISQPWEVRFCLSLSVVHLSYKAAH